MSRAVLESLRRIIPDAAPGPDGVPRVAPAAVDQAAEVLGTAAREGWRVRLEGAGTWLPADAPADLGLASGRLAAVERVAADDLVCTAQGGVALDRLQETLATRGARLALDPPGASHRTLGSVLATATAGPGREADGPVRDQVLGVTLVTGDGRILRPGGTVVKNVAGYDLAKLAVGGFGAYGLIAAAHLRLRALPPACVTLTTSGPFDPLFDGASALRRDAAQLAALELASPAATGRTDWTLLVEAAGTADAVRATVARVAKVAPALAWQRLEPEPAARLRRALAQAATAGPVTIRLGVLPDGIPDLLDLLADTIGVAGLTAGPGRGGARWCGHAPPEGIADLRRELALREIPVTLERAPWPARSRIGHFGAYRAGVARLSERLRAVFDPHHTLVVALEGGEA